MKASNRYAVILAGGRGERFWPLSTRQNPKQFISLFDGKPLLTGAVERIATFIPPENIFVLTNLDLVEVTARCLPGFPAGNILGEPVGRDTAAAVALGTALVKAQDPQGVFCVLTADHIIRQTAIFRRTLEECMALAAREPVLITIGMRPTFPSTGFGYIEAGARLPKSGRIAKFRAKRFVEKPNAATAKAYLRSGSFYWNSGMFVWSVAVIEAAFVRFRPPLAQLIRRLTGVVDAPDFPTALRREYEPLERISIDYAVMEKARNIVMAEGTFAWDDVGSWPALEHHFPRDKRGNLAIGKVEAIDCANTIAVSEGRLTALLGVKDVIVVQAGGATLVCARDRAQDIKKIVEQLRVRGGYDSLL